MNLQQIFHELNQQHFAAQLPLPRLEWNSRLSTTAGRFTPGRRNALRAVAAVFGAERKPANRSDALIEVAAYLKDIEDGLLHVRDTVLHEMIHYWLWHRRRPYGHTAEFYAKMEATGAKRYNPVPKLRPVKYTYECPGCRVKVPARRRLKDMACFECCKQHNQGYYSARYRLVMLVDHSAPGAPPPPQEIDHCNVEEPQSPSTTPPKEEVLLPFDAVVERLASLRELVQNAKIRNGKDL